MTVVLLNTVVMFRPFSGIMQFSLLWSKQELDPTTSTPTESPTTSNPSCVYIDSDGVEVIAQPNMEEPATYVEQVASQALLNQLHLDVATKRPIWTSTVVGELDNIVATGGTISCPHYLVYPLALSRCIQ